ncbi:MAG: ABC-three component system protein [Polaribacter sp.]
MKYPIEYLTDTEFENLTALICERILGIATVVFSVGKDGGKDAKFNGVANEFPSKSNPWNGKIIIQAKHTQKSNASCSDSDFKNILKKSVIPSIKKLIENNEVDYYLLFTNRKLTGIQDAKIENFFDEKTNISNRLIGLERIELWLQEYPEIVKTLNLNKLLLPLNFDQNDLKKIVNSFGKLNKIKGGIPIIPESRDIEKKNKLNNLSKEYFKNSIVKNLIYFEQIRFFLMDEINLEYLEKYENTIDDINAKKKVKRKD